MRFIDQQQEIVREIIQQSGRLLTGRPASQVAAIILDTFDEAGLL